MKINIMKTNITGNHVFGRDTCPYCRRAIEALKKASISFEYHNTETQPGAKEEMLELVGKKHCTVPQIWLDSEHIGGCDQLLTHLQK